MPAQSLRSDARRGGGLNYLCAGYKLFFSHIDKPMRTMAALLRQGRYADEIMALTATGGRGA